VTDGPTVLLYPLSGYANRLQAIASASILAEDLGGRLAVCWETSDVAPAPAGAVFDASFVAAHVVTSDEADERWGVRREAVPRYLSVDPDARRIGLAGHDRGEQHFMPDLDRALASMPEVETVVLVAGGKFCRPGTSEAAFRGQRHDFYRAMRLAPAVEEAVDRECRDRPDFVGLHLRYSDRNRQAPLRRRIRPALIEVAGRAGVRSVFVASDTGRERARWCEVARAAGLEPWTVDPGSLARAEAGSVHGALVDWRILGRARAMAFFAESSFAEEAAVAGDGWDRSIGLPASGLRAVAVQAGDYARAAVTYPRRHGWLG
jgi:hypothetical protein